jgi:hypothetical protein
MLIKRIEKANDLHQNRPAANFPLFPAAFDITTIQKHMLLGSSDRRLDSSSANKLNIKLAIFFNAMRLDVRQYGQRFQMEFTTARACCITDSALIEKRHAQQIAREAQASTKVVFSRECSTR